MATKKTKADDLAKTTVLGIDLGTTNSTASLATGSSSEAAVLTLNIDQETLQGTYTNTLVPSMIALFQGKEWIGEGAKRLRGNATESDASIFHDCKNNMGLMRTHHKAPEGYRSAAQIGGKVLQFIHQRAMAEHEGDFDRVVVTVPACFDANQRADTLLAAQLAGIELTGGDLLDEPVAAFIDYMALKPDLLATDQTTPKTLLVFDFGGGTCDIAIFRLHRNSHEGKLNIAPLAVSRYHRLGGGDIDLAVLHEVLMPQLLEQNGLTEFDLEYRERKREVEPALIGVAEQLKIKICDEVRKLQGFGKYDDADRAQVIVKQPGTVTLTVAGKAMQLTSPTLSAADFEKALAPFLDRDLLYARETEYRLTCSVFAPLQDALDRAGVTSKSVDLCLMVGGSSLIPQVTHALDQFMSNAQLLTYQNKEQVKTCVSRGAARHAYTLATTGSSLITPVCHDDIGICTTKDIMTLVPKGTALPYPSDRRLTVHEGLVVPQTIAQGKSCNLRVELVAGPERRRFFAETWNILGPVKKGEPLKLEYGFDENQVLKLRLTLTGKSGTQEFKAQTEKPFSNTVNPHSKREKALEIEEELKTGKLPMEAMLKKMVELAQMHDELGQYDKAISLLQAVMQKKHEPDAYLINRIANLYGQKGDVAKMEKFFKEAIGIDSSWHGPSFNLALSQKKRGKLQEAAQTLDTVLHRDREAPYLVLRASIADQMKDLPLKQELLEEARTSFGTLEALSPWELGWCLSCASMLADEEGKRAAEAEIKRRAREDQNENDSDDSGVLPFQAPTSEGDK